MNKFIGLLSLISCAVAAPHTGFVASQAFLQAEPVVAALPVATSYANSYQTVVKSPLVATAPVYKVAPLVSAPVATSYANVYQKIESTAVLNEQPATTEEPERDVEPVEEPEAEVEPEQSAESEPEVEAEIETVAEVEPAVVVKEVAAAAPVATSYANVYQTVEKRPVFAAASVIAAAPVATYANFYQTAPLVAVSTPFVAAAQPVSYVASGSFW